MPRMKHGPPVPAAECLMVAAALASRMGIGFKLADGGEDGPGWTGPKKANGWDEGATLSGHLPTTRDVGPLQKRGSAQSHARRRAACDATAV